MYKELYKILIDNAKLETRIKNQGTYYEQNHEFVQGRIKNND